MSLLEKHGFTRIFLLIPTLIILLQNQILKAEGNNDLECRSKFSQLIASDDKFNKPDAIVENIQVRALGSKEIGSGRTPIGNDYISRSYYYGFDSVTLKIPKLDYYGGFDKNEFFLSTSIALINSIRNGELDLPLNPPSPNAPVNILTNQNTVSASEKKDLGKFTIQNFTEVELNYLKSSIGDGHLKDIENDEGMLRHWKKLMDTVFAEQLKKLNEEANAYRHIHLEEIGINRFFWFVPSGQKNLVPARVLDIRQSVQTIKSPIPASSNAAYASCRTGRCNVSQSSGGSKKNETNYDFSTIITIEYLIVDPKTSELQIVVSELTESELTYVYDIHPISKAGRDIVQLQFDYNSSIGVKKAKLAAIQNRFTIYKYVDAMKVGSAMDNSPQYAHSYRGTPFRMMDNNVYIAISDYIKKQFGDFSDLYTDLDREKLPMPNPMDIFARLSPAYVASRYVNHKALDTIFYWVVTDSGQLKIMPAVGKSYNLLPQLIRLATARPVYAAGSFYLQEDLRISLIFDATYYEAADYREAYRIRHSNSSVSFQVDTNKDLVRWVQGIFANQAGLKVYSYKAIQNDAYYAKNTGNYSDGQQRAYEDRKQNFAESFFSHYTKNANTEETNPYVWTEAPLSYSAFEQAFKDKNKPANFKEMWAHYVLRTNINMSEADIKKAFKRLIMQYHPDKAQDPAAKAKAEETSKIINTARDELAMHFMVKK